MQGLDGIEHEVGGPIDLAIIWLHGLGADGRDFLPIVGELALPVGVRYVFPNAPFRSVTINGGMVMRAWYDVLGFGPDAPEDTAGLAASVGAVRDLVAREVERGLPRERIILAGFSQGGAVVLHAGLGAREELGGILGLSTYLPAPAMLAAGGQLPSDVPVLMVHGTEDPVIPLTFAQRSVQWLNANGVDVEWQTYRMGHEVIAPEIGAINGWLRRCAMR